MPTPPEAMTGTRTASATARVSSRSKPDFVPSRSIEVSRISPAPSDTTSCANATASRPVGLRPPCVKISQRGGSPSLGNAARVDRDDDALVAEFFRRARDEGTVGHGRCVDRHLVGAGEQQRADILDGAHAAADGDRHEALLGGAAHDIEDGGAVLVARGDVEEAELVGPGRVIGLRRLDRIAGVDQVDELHALDDAPVLHVEAGNEAGLQHGTATRLAGRV